jgi:proteic killer suppression protein
LIEPFGDARTERLFQDRVVREFQGFAARAKRKLEAIHAAARLEDLAVPPSNPLEKRGGKLSAFYSIRIDGQWRVIFQWTGNNAHKVSIVDYH